MNNIFANIYTGVVHFILPPTCICCDKLLNGDERFVCKFCFDSLIPVKKDSWVLSSDRTFDTNRIFSLYEFSEESKIQQIIHALKYRKFKSIGIMFGALLGNGIKNKTSINFDYIVPVPLHRSKKRERGYNQSDYVARGISTVLNSDVLEKCLKRTRFTKTQTQLDIHERRENVSGAFVLNNSCKDKIIGKNLLIVDDVITTGSTILECSRVLKAGGCGEVMICSVAKAL